MMTSALRIWRLIAASLALSLALLGPAAVGLAQPRAFDFALIGCWLLQAKKADPLELLSKLRTQFFPEGRSLGQKPIAVRQQSADANFSKFRENLRWPLTAVCARWATNWRPTASRLRTCTVTRTFSA